MAANGKHKGGRPKVADPKIQVPIRMNHEEKETFKRAAAAQGQELGPWARLVMHAAAKKVLGG